MTGLSNKISVFACILLLAGCVGNKKIFVPVSPSDEKGSVVYIYRPAKAANVMLTPDVSVAGIKTFGIKNGEYKQLYLLPGQHVIKLAATEGNTPAVKHDLEVAKEGVYYLRVDASMKLEFGQTYQPYKRKFELQEMLAKDAITEISACADMDAQVKLKKPVIAVEVNDGDEVNDEPEASFSVDKTSNPFSR